MGSHPPDRDKTMGNSGYPSFGSIFYIDTCDEDINYQLITKLLQSLRSDIFATRETQIICQVNMRLTFNFAMQIETMQIAKAYLKTNVDLN